MADRYPNRSFPAGDGYERDAGSRDSGNAEGDPLAELARLIGQNDPFGSKPMSRANLQAQPHARHADPAPSYDDGYYQDFESEEVSPPAPPSWMQRATWQDASPPSPPPLDDHPAEVHPLHRYAAAHPQAAEPHYDPEPLFEDSDHEPDPSRYDEALYGSLGSGNEHASHDEGYADEAYSYEEDQHFQVPEPQRRGGMITVAAVLALAVFGVGGALAYRSYTGGVRTGEPPIIRADAGPTKIVPAPADSSTKVPDRMTSGDGAEKMVPREETPMDTNTRSVGPRVVFPPLSPNGSAPMPSGIVPGAAPPAANGGTFSNNDPRTVRTVPVRGDQASAGAPSAAAPPAAAAVPAKPARAAVANARASASNPNAANANSPMSLAPQADAPAADPVRVAATNPTQTAPAVPASGGAAGNYLVSVTSQPSEAEAQASYRAMQGKYPSVLGSQSATVARGNTKDGKVTYRAGPAFGTPAEAAQFCHSYVAAGGQCWVVKN